MAHFRIEKTVLSDRRLPCPGRVVVLGRSLDADVPLPHKSVSRRHALIEAQDVGYVISDLGSSNGTFIGDKRLEAGERAQLKLGDRFRLGHVELVLAADEVISDEESDTGPSPSPPGALQLAPPPSAMAPAPAAPPRKVAVAETTVKERRRAARPDLAKRQAHRKAKQDAMRWVGVAVTVVLLTLAGIFVSKIVSRTQGEKEKAEAEAAEEAAAREAEKVKPAEFTPLEKR